MSDDAESKRALEDARKDSEQRQAEYQIDPEIGKRRRKEQRKNDVARNAGLRGEEKSDSPAAKNKRLEAKKGTKRTNQLEPIDEANAKRAVVVGDGGDETEDDEVMQQALAPPQQTRLREVSDVLDVKEQPPQASGVVSRRLARWDQEADTRITPVTQIRPLEIKPRATEPEPKTTDETKSKQMIEAAERALARNAFEEPVSDNSRPSSGDDNSSSSSSWVAVPQPAAEMDNDEETKRMLEDARKDSEARSMRLQGAGFVRDRARWTQEQKDAATGLRVDETSDDGPNPKRGAPDMTIGPEEHEDKQAEVPVVAVPPIPQPPQQAAAEPPLQQRAENLRTAWGQANPRSDPDDDDDDDMDVNDAEPVVAAPVPVPAPAAPLAAGGDGNLVADLGNMGNRLGAVMGAQFSLTRGDINSAQRMVLQAKAHIERLEEKLKRCHDERKQALDKLTEARNNIAVLHDDLKDEDVRMGLEGVVDTMDTALRQLGHPVPRMRRQARDANADLRARIASAMLISDMLKLIRKLQPTPEEEKEMHGRVSRLLRLMTNANGDLAGVAAAMRRELRDGKEEDCKEVRKERDKLKKENDAIYKAMDRLFLWCELTRGMLGRLMTGWRVAELPSGQLMIDAFVEAAQNPGPESWLLRARGWIKNWLDTKIYPVIDPHNESIPDDHPIFLLDGFTQGEGPIAQHVRSEYNRVTSRLERDGNQTKEQLVTEIYMTHVEFTRHLFTLLHQDETRREMTRTSYWAASISARHMEQQMRESIVKYLTRADKEFDKFKSMMQKSSDAVFLAGWVSSGLAASKVLQYLPTPDQVRERMTLVALNAYPHDERLDIEDNSEYHADKRKIAELQNKLYREYLDMAGVGDDNM